MRLSHLGKVPHVHPDAWVAPDATLCGDVRLGAGARVMHGARLVAEGGSIEIGPETIVLENAVLRATADHDCRIGAHVLIGPGAHVVGATLEDEVFIASGAAIFHGARVGRGSVVRIHAVVHVTSHLPPGSTVPIGWIACGNPAELFSPDRHEDLWRAQEPLNFTRTAYGIEPPLGPAMAKVTAKMSERLAGHREDRQVP